jgi:hypothetical protein
MWLQDLALAPPVKSDGFTRAKVTQARVFRGTTNVK